MRRTLSLLLPIALLCACSNTVLVSVPPRMDLKKYDTLGIVDFTSSAERGLGARAARQFQEQVQQAQPGTRFVELGDRDALLAAVGARQLGPDALRQIGQKYGVAAVFVGELVYSEPTVDVKLMDVAKLEGGVRAEVKGDISSRLLETATGVKAFSVGKPSPVMMRAARKELRLATSQTVMIGDTGYDMRMAVAAGTRGIGVAWGYHHPRELEAAGAEWVAESPGELLEYLLK